MGENKYDVFDNNINEIKELNEKLKEPLEEPINILYYDIEKKKIKYKGGYIDKKREGKGISYNEQGKIIYIGNFSLTKLDNIFHLIIINEETYIRISKDEFLDGRKLTICNLSCIKFYIKDFKEKE